MKDYNNLKKKNSASSRKGLWSLFGPILAVLLCIILFILVRFSIVAREQAKKDIQEQLTSNAYVTVHEAALDLGQIMSVGNVASGMLNDDGVDYDHWKETIRYISESNSKVYMTSIVDATGHGICSVNDKIIDLSNVDYYKRFTDPYFAIINDDEITNNSALVCVNPIVSNGSIIGYVSQYVHILEINKLLPLEGNDTNNGLIVIKNDGDIVLKRGTCPMAAGQNLFNILENSQVTGISFEKIESNVGYNITQTFDVQIGNENYMMVSIPMNVGGWTMMQVLKSEYIEMLVDRKSAAERDLVKALGLICVLTVICIFAIVLVSRARDRQASRDLENKADTDLLTGLNNKIATERKIKEALEYGHESQHLLLLFDIDNFKKINDTMGHAFGDQVLKSLGEQLSQEFRKSDILGRTGGDEFTFLIRDLKSDDIIIKECEKITNFFNHFQIGDYVKYSATASIGAAVYPRDGKDFEELYKSADTALYEAKKLGKNRLRYRDKELAETVENMKKQKQEEAK